MKPDIYNLVIIFIVNIFCWNQVLSSSIRFQRGAQLVRDSQTTNQEVGPTQFVIDQNEQVNQNSSFTVAAYFIQNVCGITLNYESNSNNNFNNFCHDSFKKNKDIINRYLKEEPSDDERKCYSFLCAWYQEKCDEIVRRHQEHPTETVMNETPKCNCLYNLWSRCNCDIVLNVKENNLLKENEIFPIDVRFGGSDKVQTSSHREIRLNPDMEGYQNDANVQSRMASDDPDSFVFAEDGDSSAKPWEKKPSTSDPFDVNMYSEEQRKCFSLKQLWFNNQCVKLKTSTPCGDGEWLVLKKPIDGNNLSELEPECQLKKCIKKEEIWWSSENRCVNKSEASRKYCKGKDVLVDYDSFGDGFCTCYDDTGSFEDSNDCYEFYQKGPCKITEVVTYNMTSGYAMCSKDLCYELNHPNTRRRQRRFNDAKNSRIFKREILIPVDYSERKPFIENYDVLIRKYIDPYNPNIQEEFEKYDRFKRQTGSRRSSSSEKKYYAPLGGNGQCYKFGPQAICDQLGEDAQFKFHKLLKVPECFVSTSNALHLIDSRPGCKVDESNNCRQEVKLAQTSELDFLTYLKNQARKKRDAKPK